MHALSSAGVFQIRSTHSHNNSIYAATAEYYIIRPTPITTHTHIYIHIYILYVLNVDHLSCTIQMSINVILKNIILNREFGIIYIILYG